jgi:hypothetical protein
MPEITRDTCEQLHGQPDGLSLRLAYEWRDRVGTPIVRVLPQQLPGFQHSTVFVGGVPVGRNKSADWLADLIKLLVDES